jgi:transposase-like protein
MVQVKDLTELKLEDLWREVKWDEEDWWGDVKQETLRVVKRLLESVMEEELLEQLCAGRYRRTKLRRGYRNGYRSRTLLTELGLVENLRVPRDRDGEYQPTVVVRYQHYQKRVNGLIRECFLAGMSTRRVGEVLAPILGEAPSPQTVSRVAQSLDAEVRRFHHRPLADHYLYLIIDAIVLKVKGATGVRRRLVLCVYGITIQGEREIISFRQASAESEAQWEAFLRDLYDRGLKGNGLALIVTDGHPGLLRALDMVYPYVPLQRCWVHKLRNVAAKLPRKVQEPCLKGAKEIYQASTRREAVACFRKWANEWHSSQPKAISCLEADLDELLNFLKCPRAHWCKIRTTNAIERAFREVRRRTRPMSCFQNPESVDRIIYGITNHLNSTWKEKPIPQFTHSS